METKDNAAGTTMQGAIRILKLISILIWIGFTVLCIVSALHGDRMNLVGSIGSDHFFQVNFFVLPYLLLGGLYGYFASLFSFVIAFITALIFNMRDAYTMSVNLVALMCFSMFSQYFWFKTPKKTALAAFWTLLATSFLEVICLTFLCDSQYRFSAVLDIEIYFLRDMLNILVQAFLLYLIFTKLPDAIKIIFPLGVGYTRAYSENHELQKRFRKTKVSVKITTIIVSVEIILGIAAAFFMIALFPDMREVFVGTVRDDLPSLQSSVQSVYEAEENPQFGDITRDDIIEGIRDVEYRFSYAAFTYDLKMVLLMMCIGVPMAGFANYYTKTKIGEPLGIMSDFMDEFANADDEGKPDVGMKVDSIVISNNDEIGTVFEAMKSMVHATGDYIQRLRERQELEKELEVAQKASEAKSSFLSNVSHEIRTPINAVLGMNEMILRESDDEQILEYANNVKSAGTSLLGIINDILDFSKIEAGKMDILPVEYHLGSTINDLINMISVKAEDKGLKLEVNVDETTPSLLFGDEIRIKQCVTNILSNAVKYTESGSVTMNVTYRKADDDNIMLRFQVVDTGIGIKEEDLSKLFSPFERIEEIRNRSIEGTGLGMSIVKKLLAMMDTRLEVKSVYGEGSDFSFEVKQQVTGWEEIGDFKEKYREYLKSQEKYREKFRAPSAEILVVDDTPMNLLVMKGLLKATEITVDTAESGRQTLEKVKQRHYDAIFIDHRMPEMDGPETLAAMKELEGNLNIGVPCIALTANAGPGAEEEYRAAGFDGYVAKPINGPKLEDLLSEILPSEKILSADEQKDVSAGNDVLKKLKGIDLGEAISNCGSEELLADVVREFRLEIDSRAEKIEGYLEEKDYRNYTIQVHSLKSSARIIGAAELSEKAAYLEKCGDEENEREILAKTPELIELLRSYKDNLSAIDGGNGDTDDNNNEENEELPMISDDQLAEAYMSMKELLSAFDFDSAESIFNMLSGYTIPEDKKAKYTRIKELFAAFDTEGLLKEL